MKFSCVKSNNLSKVFCLSIHLSLIAFSTELPQKINAIIGITAITVNIASKRIILYMDITDKNKASTIMMVPHPVNSPIASISVVKEDMILPALFSWKNLWDNLSVFKNISWRRSLSTLLEAISKVKRIKVLPANSTKDTITRLITMDLISAKITPSFELTISTISPKYSGI